MFSESAQYLLLTAGISAFAASIPIIIHILNQRAKAKEDARRRVQESRKHDRLTDAKFDEQLTKIRLAEMEAAVKLRQDYAEQSKELREENRQIREEMRSLRSGYDRSQEDIKCLRDKLDSNEDKLARVQAHADICDEELGKANLEIDGLTKLVRAQISEDTDQ